ncbi:ATP-binding protein [Massilia sp. LjRoot122]|uniref:ATP-binding protein n=1 Tax=Massilia sp. LjRoot122 TaxID=3342257 RepID=UPI003ECE238B
MTEQRHFNITPTPRLLERLGELPIEQFQCLGELIDNPIDKFKEAIRDGHSFEQCQIKITLPTADHAEACITVQDNGPGMSADELEHAVRAGWSSNHANDHLGMFGVGFNTATSRLGLVTEVYTTRAGDDHWIGVRIDFGELISRNSFLAPGLTRVKSDPAMHGTEIRIKRLRIVHRAYFSKATNIQSVRNELARIYAPLLLDAEHPFELEVNRVPVAPRKYCTWDESRTVSVDRMGNVHAVERFEIPLPPRQYCPDCLLTFDGDDMCPQCGQTHDIRQIQRRLYGWVGIQRFIHPEKYGIDLVRNGRVIESQNKDLFMWRDDDKSEQEYPVDDMRNRGRIIGVVNIDHGAVTFTKDRFERSDPAWAEMLTMVRGDGPLRPNIARKLGYGPSQAPLYRLFQAFRRNEPKPPTPWGQVLAVKDYKLAAAMADLFYRGDPDYQSDEKWFELVERQDRELEAATGARADPNLPPPAFLERDASAARRDRDASHVRLEVVAEAPPRPTSHRKTLPGLSGKYHHRLIDMDFGVAAFSVTAEDPDLPTNAPWALIASVMSPGDHLFLVDLGHRIFQSMTMTALDALLAELAMKAYTFLEQQQRHHVTFAQVLADFRLAYAGESALEYGHLVSIAKESIYKIAVSIAGKADARELAELFEELDQDERDTIRRRAAAIGICDTSEFIANGQFLGHAEHDTIRFFVGRHPELFFDGNYWRRPYEGLNLGSARVNNAARQALSEQFDSYLADAAWLAAKSPGDLARQDRNALIRAALSLRLLTPG